jgi:hypothetical protein
VILVLFLVYTQSSSETATKNQSSVSVGFSVAPAKTYPPYSWTISGQGASLVATTTILPVNAFDLVNGCGPITITMTDNCTYVGIAVVRVTDAGYWCRISTCDFQCSFYIWSGRTVDEISGKYRKTAYWCYRQPAEDCNGAPCYLNYPQYLCTTDLPPQPAYEPQYTKLCACVCSLVDEWKCTC